MTKTDKTLEAPQQDSGLEDELKTTIAAIERDLEREKVDGGILVYHPKTMKRILSSLRQQPNDLLVEARDALKGALDSLWEYIPQQNWDHPAIKPIDATLTKLNEALGDRDE